RLLDRKTEIERGIDRRLNEKCAKAVGDETGRVFTLHHALTERFVAEIADDFDRIAPRLRPHDQFQQSHVTRRIKEMGDEKIILEIAGLPAGEHSQWNSRGVGRYNGARLTHRIDR